MLDIIIPQYSEDNNMIKPLLDSIKKGDGVRSIVGALIGQIWMKTKPLFRLPCKRLTFRQRKVFGETASLLAIWQAQTLAQIACTCIFAKSFPFARAN